MGFAAHEDQELLRCVLAYVTRLFEELTQENGGATARHAEPGGRLHPRRAGVARGGRPLGRDGANR
jgi:hypothetical protein